ncbi:MAG: hypothetical protein COT74_03580 [Bdellovibrionales bacterium CG10_big_fil_rev_8_21_14_0_10_45_34]|nr:MAG: hypothetical protein COT74_03580 [Bdellovibrionales bacterium CG10_big_fil_rev_8_21_14_0_10_45_34]
MNFFPVLFKEGSSLKKQLPQFLLFHTSLRNVFLGYLALGFTLSFNFYAHAVGNFCPRLEGMDLKCDQISPTGLPVPEGCGSPALNCYQCEHGSYTNRIVSSYCPSWSCEIIPVPEGPPQRRAKCAAAPVECCNESTINCCETTPKQGTAKGTLLDEATCHWKVECDDPTLRPGFPLAMCRPNQVCGDLPKCKTVSKPKECPI